MRLALALLRGADGEVLFSPQINIVIGHHITAGDRDIVATDIDRTRRQHGADRQCLAPAVFGVRGGTGRQTFVLTGMNSQFIMLFGLGGERDIPARRQLQCAVGLYRAGAEGDVFCCL
ncbi:Uncharacterised protein [Yersinia intermedia]|nr:Uncharacterised protein [Yersinia intermedia]CNK48666.1 Uncharacterised protein [Yersinia intermedia]